MALPLNYTLNNRGGLTTTIPPVDPAGDVNLCIRRTYFLVSSKAFALGSKVFYAMFLCQRFWFFTYHFHMLYTIICLYNFCLLLPTLLPAMLPPILYVYNWHLTAVIRVLHGRLCLDICTVCNLWYWACCTCNPTSPNPRSTSMPRTERRRWPLSAQSRARTVRLGRC